MDFFERQERARRNTWKLILLYTAAVILIIASVYLIALILFGQGDPPGTDLTESFWHPELFLAVSALTMTLILGGTLYRIASLRSGGSAVAEMIGGHKVDPSTTDPKERMLLNIVEEMSIASGLSVPDVYLLDREESINAFAAGYTISDAAVGITRGALDQLSRDELQGVVAHEFSHIFNGDMRLNIRLIGILNGILLLHIAGMILMRSTLYRGHGMSRPQSQDRGQRGDATIAILLFGVALMIIGSVGMFFGRLIQAAISRQREYLADAAAVQYTRNPEGLAGALIKIAHSSEKGAIRDGHAMEMSHLFFVNSYHSLMGRLIATHPPIEKRIQALLPAYETYETGPDPERQRWRAESSSPSADRHRSPGPEQLIAAVGTPSPDLIPLGEELLREIPQTLIEAAREPLDAEALIYALLLTEQDPGEAEITARFNRFTRFRGNPDLPVMKRIGQLKGKPRRWFLPLAELSLPALRTMSRKQYERFRNMVVRLVKEDGKVTLFEFSLQKLILSRLDTHFGLKEPVRIRHFRIREVREEFIVLLSALARESKEAPDEALNAGIELILKMLGGPAELLPPEKSGTEQIDRALDKLAGSSLPVRKELLSAAARTVLRDKKVTVEELELLRVFSDVLECPMPLLQTDSQQS